MQEWYCMTEYDKVAGGNRFRYKGNWYKKLGPTWTKLYDEPDNKGELISPQTIVCASVASLYDFVQRKVKDKFLIV